MFATIVSLSQASELVVRIQQANIYVRRLITSSAPCRSERRFRDIVSIFSALGYHGLIGRFEEDTGCT